MQLSHHALGSVPTGSKIFTPPLSPHQWGRTLANYFSENGISRPKLLQTPHHFSPGNIFTEHTSAKAAEATTTAINKTFSSFSNPFCVINLHEVQYSISGPLYYLQSGGRSSNPMTDIPSSFAAIRIFSSHSVRMLILFGCSAIS